MIRHIDKRPCIIDIWKDIQMMRVFIIDNRRKQKKKIFSFLVSIGFYLVHIENQSTIDQKKKKSKSNFR